MVEWNSILNRVQHKPILVMARKEGNSGGGVLRPVLIFSTLLIPVLLGVAIRYHQCILDTLLPLPDLKSVFPFEDEVWTVAASGSAEETTAIVPWKLKVSDADLEDLKDRLRKTRYGTAMAGQNFAYGFPADQLKKVNIIF